MKHNIYADNAATTKLDIDAFEAMKPYLLDEYGNASQPYSFGRRAKLAIRQARKTIAECINADPQKIIFTSGGSESDNWAVKCFCSYTDIKHLITSEIEHHAVLNAVESAKRMFHADTFYIPVSKTGEVSCSDLVKVLERPREAVATCESTLVSVMMANNEIGTIQPIKELAAIAHEHCACFHTDAVQAVGHIPIDVKELGVNYLSASAHKFNGPKGIGFLYVNNGSVTEQLINGGAQEFGLRAGTENVAAIVGMAVALKKNCEKIKENELHIRSLEKVIIDGLNESGIDYIRNGSDNRIPGNLSLSFRGKDGEAILHRMDLMGIAVSTGSACDSVNTQISYVLKAIHLPEDYARGTIRISLGRENTEKEARRIVDALLRIILD